MGRYELLKECQEYVHGKEPNTILVLTGPSGCGKSNVMAGLSQMFSQGQRIRTNANTKLLEFQHHKPFDASKRGSSWDNPEVVSLFMGASNGYCPPSSRVVFVMRCPGWTLVLMLPLRAVWH